MAWMMACCAAVHLPPTAMLELRSSSTSIAAGACIPSYCVAEHSAMARSAPRRSPEGWLTERSTGAVAARSGLSVTSPCPGLHETELMPRVRLEIRATTHRRMGMRAS